MQCGSPYHIIKIYLWICVHNHLIILVQYDSTPYRSAALVGKSLLYRRKRQFPRALAPGLLRSLARPWILWYLMIPCLRRVFHSQIPLDNLPSNPPLQPPSSFRLSSLSPRFFLHTAHSFTRSSLDSFNQSRHSHFLDTFFVPTQSTFNTVPTTFIHLHTLYSIIPPNHQHERNQRYYPGPHRYYCVCKLGPSLLQKSILPPSGVSSRKW